MEPETIPGGSIIPRGSKTERFSVPTRRRIEGSSGSKLRKNPTTSTNRESSWGWISCPGFNSTGVGDGARPRIRVFTGATPGPGAPLTAGANSPGMVTP